MVDESKAMVESKSHAAAGSKGLPAGDLVDLNGLGDRRLQLADVVRFLGNEGVGEEVVRKLVTATQLMQSPDGQLPLIPRDLITLAEASGRFSISVGALRNWVTRGRLEIRGREQFRARGGGKILIDATDVENLIQNPPRPGRPRN